MDLYNLGPVSWIESQSLYHALAWLGREGLIICYPASPYVCLGLHDDLEYEIDLDYCRERQIPLLRRETGGGVVYLDHRQIFYQLVLRRDNPRLPLRRPQLYPKFLRPAIDWCRSAGIAAELKAPADIAVRGRKCSGNACGDIGNSVAYVGNLLLEFDFDTMSGVLRVPHDAFRWYLLRSMREHMTTLTECCGNRSDYSRLADGLIQGFEREWGGLAPRPVDEELKEASRVAGERLTAPEWLAVPGRRPPERRVKIAEGVYLSEHRTGPRSSLILEKNGMEIVLSQQEPAEAAIL